MAKASSIELKDLLSAIDRKDVNWWETLTPEQRKEFSPWLAMRFTSMVTNSPEYSQYYLLATNNRINKKFNSLKDHKKLQYLLLTTASPGLGTKYHKFVKPPKRGQGSTKVRNVLEKLFPMANDQEIDVLIEHNSHKDIQNFLIAHGWTDKAINEAIGKDTDKDE